MNANDKRKFDMLKRVLQFHVAPAFTMKPKATELLAQVQATVDETRLLARDQVSGRGESRGGSTDRKRVAQELEQALRAIARTARSLDAEQFPGVADQFRVPESLSYQSKINSARAFVRDLPPLEQAFVDREMHETFIADLSALVTEFQAASARKRDGRTDEVGSTAGMRATLRKGVASVRKLNSILSNQFKNSPGLFAAWKSASRIERSPRRADEAVNAAASATPATA